MLDASILLMPLVLFIAPTDPRWLSTLDAIGGELVSDSLVYRYNVEASPDGTKLYVVNSGGSVSVIDLNTVASL